MACGSIHLQVKMLITSFLSFIRLLWREYFASLSVFDAIRAVASTYLVGDSPRTNGGFPFKHVF